MTILPQTGAAPTARRRAMRTTRKCRTSRRRVNQLAAQQCVRCVFKRAINAADGKWQQEKKKQLEAKILFKFWCLAVLKLTHQSDAGNRKLSNLGLAYMQMKCPYLKFKLLGIVFVFKFYKFMHLITKSQFSPVSNVS